MTEQIIGVWGRAVEAAAQKVIYDRRGEPWNRILRDKAWDGYWDKERGRVRETLTAAVPVILADLANRIEEERVGDDVDEWNVALMKAAEIVRSLFEEIGQ